MIIVYVFLLMTVFKPKNLPQRLPTATPMPTETQSPTATAEPTKTPVSEEPTEEKSKIEEPILDFILINGANLGTYGSYVTLNANTDMPNTYVAYFVPAGTYKVESYDKPWSQVNVYSAQTKIVDGWEEPAVTSSVLINYKEIGEIEVPEGYYVKVAPSSRVNLYRIK